MRELGKTLIFVILALSFAYSFMLVSYTYSSMQEIRQAFHLTGDASSQISLCINTPPSVNVTNCPTSGVQGQAYVCSVGGIDDDGHNVTFSSSFTLMSRTYSNSTTEPFSLNSSGYGNFTPANSDVGTFTISIVANDSLNCSNSGTVTLRNITINNTNDAPILDENIPNLQFADGGAISFFLSTYFSDPDGDTLNYSVSGNSQISIVIESSSRVTITSATCDVTELVLFTAMDPYNETATSNPVEIECQDTTSTPPSSSGGGSSGGSGGGSSRPCVSEFECYDYYMCNASNQLLQKCVDKEGCKRDEFLTVPCKYDPNNRCTENWRCGQWSACMPEGLQYRNCTDSASCRSPRFEPENTQACTYLGTCEDKILNCHDGSCEEEIDCGGPCMSCKQIEVPYLFPDEKGLSIYFVSSIILLLLIAALIYQYFRKEINAAFAKASWLITRKKSKKVLLKDEDKKKLLAELAKLEKKLFDYDVKDLNDKRDSLLRYYLTHVMLGLAENFTAEKLTEALEKNKKRLGAHLKKIFASLFNARKIADRREALMAIEELRNIVVQTSIIEQGDIARAEKEIKILPQHKPLEAGIIKITNSYVALEFEQLDVAKKMYLDILGHYEKLEVKEQEIMYETIARLYTNISYVNSWLPKPIEP